MPHFGSKSQERLIKVHPDLRRVLNSAIKEVDFTVVWGYRNEETQDQMYADGATKLPWPMSNHNTKPSRAVDIVPYPALYDATYEEFYELAAYMFEAAMDLEIRIMWGGHWKNYTGQGDMDRDWAHWELR